MKRIGGLQVGGGINPENASSYIEEGASHVIVTSVSFFLLSIYDIGQCIGWNGGQYNTIMNFATRNFLSYCSTRISNILKISLKRLIDLKWTVLELPTMALMLYFSWFYHSMCSTMDKWILQGLKILFALLGNRGLCWILVVEKRYFLCYCCWFFFKRKTSFFIKIMK